MLTLWNRLAKFEREALLSVHRVGAFPRHPHVRTCYVLLDWMRRNGTWTAEWEAVVHGANMVLPPFIQEWDEALEGLHWHPFEGHRLLEGLGNWGRLDGSRPACHPAFRACRLTEDGQRAVLEGLDIRPPPIEDDALGTLVWNPAECWWERRQEWRHTSHVVIALDPDTMGAPPSLELARRTLAEIKKRSPRIEQVAAREAVKPSALVLFSDKAVAPPVISSSELAKQLTWSTIALDIKGGAYVSFQVKGWDSCKIEAEVTVDGSCEAVEMCCR